MPKKDEKTDKKEETSPKKEEKENYKKIKDYKYKIKEIQKEIDIATKMNGVNELEILLDEKKRILERMKLENKGLKNVRNLQSKEEIDGDTYFKKMMDLTTSHQKKKK